VEQYASQSRNSQESILDMDTGTMESFDFSPDESTPMLEKHQDIRNKKIVSPDRRHYLAMYKVITYPSNDGYKWFTLDLFDTATNNREAITTQARIGVQAHWLSNDLLVYDWVDPAAEDNTSDDFYAYDLRTRQTRQLTDTPELNEGYSCSIG
jgi:hypothetical protein